MLKWWFAGAGKVRVQPPHHPFPWRRLPVPRHLLLLTGHGGDGQVHGHRAARHQPQDGRQAVQVQLRPQAVHCHPRQDCVGQHRRTDHPQSPLAGQETSKRTEEVKRRQIESFCYVNTVGQDPTRDHLPHRDAHVPINWNVIFWQCDNINQSLPPRLGFPSCMSPIHVFISSYIQLEMGTINEALIVM